MKRLIFVVFFTLFILVGAFYAFLHMDDINNYYQRYILKDREKLTINKNDYFYDASFKYVAVTDDFIAKDRKQIMDIYYTIINSGETDFTFYCDDNYKSCLDDVKAIGDNQDILSNINNFVHPFNSFKNIETSYNKYGKVMVKLTHNYSSDMIYKINEEVDKIISSKITNNMNQRQKVKAIHDYIIKNTKYDQAHDDVNSDATSNTAYGVLFDHVGLCGGYADTMAIFLNRFHVKSYKIATDMHVWNLVFLDNKPLHLDVTWDDPITSNNKDSLEYYFFLVTTKQLEKLKVGQHNFDKNVYIEAK